MSNIFLLRCIGVALGAALVEASGTARAQNAAAPPDGAVQDSRTARAEASAQEADSKIPQIIVTARKRTEALQDVPISVQVISSQTLQQENFNSLEELSETLPGVNITSRSGANLLTIRGIGSGENTAFDQSVAQFTDDIYHGRSRMSLGAFLDLDHIEVLKGPQSTFFGNNAIAGALNIVTKKPGDQFEASGRLLYGQFEQYAADGVIGGPLTDTFGVRLAVTRNGDARGWLYNETTNDHVPRINNVAGRLTLDFHPEDLVAILKIEASRHSTAGSANELPEQMSNCPPPAPLPVTYAFFGTCAVALSENLPVGLQRDKLFGVGGEGNSLSTFDDVLALNYDHWGHTLTSVTGFYNYHFDSTSNPGQLPLASQITVAFQLPEKYHQFSEELRVTSPTDQPVEYMAGAYFQTDELEQHQVVMLPFLNAVGPFLGLPPTELPLSESLPFIESEHVYSLFGSLKWNLTSHLNIAAGLRASKVDKDATMSRHYGVGTGTFCCFAPTPPADEAAWSPILGPTFNYSFSRTDHALMPSIDVQYKVSPAMMLYFSYRRGFKAGGFTNAFGTLGTFSFNPEHAHAYELGLKSTWLDDRVLFNLDVFRTNYRGLQLTNYSQDPQTGITSSLIGNAAASVSEGAELETQWAVTAGFRLAANVTYLHAYFSDYHNAPSTSDLQLYCAGLAPAQFAATAQCAIYPSPVPPTMDLTGQPTPYAPRWTGSIKASYSVLLPRDNKLVAELSPYFTSSFNHQVPDLPGLSNNGYVRLDARLGLETADGRWAFDLIGKNLTDRVIIVYPTLGFQSKEQPRNFAAQIRFRW